MYTWRILFIYVSLNEWDSLCGNDNLAVNTPCCKSAALRSSMFLIYKELGLGGVYTMGE